MIFLAAFIACNENGNENSLPPDPKDWVCKSSEIGPGPEEIEQYCSTADPGLPAPDFLRNPSPLSNLGEKNIYDIQMQDFLRARGYVTELDWPGDMNWRLTGPYVGSIGSGQSYGVHPAVRL
ncbi:MAG TPA: hypothetical protein VJV40_05495, partial [Thermodesulfobacteriota bacterium]|nr:hypothetical protein [Thermodesulfobacteriota bacterium]